MRPLKLRTRLTVLILVIAIPIFSSVVIFVSTQAGKLLEESALDDLHETNRALGSSVSQWLGSYTVLLRQLTALPDIISMEAERQKPALLATSSADPNLFLVQTVDLNGINVARNDDSSLRDYSDRQWYLGARAGNPITTEALISRTTGNPALNMSMPIRDAKGAVIGVMSIVSELDDVTAAVRASKVGDTGYAYVVDDLGHVIAHPDPAFSKDLRDLSGYPPVMFLQTGSQGTINFTDEQGVRWVANVGQLENGWGIIVQQQETELLGPLRYFQFASWTFSVIGILLLLAATGWVIHRALNPIEALTETVLTIAGGDLERIAPVENKDEVGTLASAFNSMTARMRELIFSLEQRVHQLDQTQVALNASLLRQAAILDNIPDLAWLKDEESRFIAANEPFGQACGVAPAELIGKTDLDIWPEELAQAYRKDDFEVMRTRTRKHVEERLVNNAGQEGWIETVKTPIFDATGKVIGTAGIARDITIRKQMEEAMANRATQLAKVAYLSSIVSAILDIGKLLAEVTDLVKEQFAYYHAHIYLLNDAGDMLVLAAGAGETGRQMLAKGHHIPLDHPHSLVARVAREKQGLIVNNVTRATDFLPNPLLPNTRSELAVPLIFGDRVMGVFDVQSEEMDHFAAEDISIQTTLAGQIAVSIQNAQQFAERKRAEEALRDSEVRYRAIVEGTTDLICRFLPDTTLTFVNEAYCRYFGQSREQLIGTLFLELIPENEQEGVQAHVNSIIRNKVPFTYSHEVIASTGEIRWQQWTDSTILDDVGEVVELQSVGRDITEQMRVEKALQESERRFREMLQGVNLAGVMLDGSGQVTFINEFLLRITGWAREEALGKDWCDQFLPSDVREEVRIAFNQLLRDGKIIPHYENEIITRHGERRLIRWNNTVLFDSNGNAIGTASIGEDITESRQVEDALRTSEERYRLLFENNPNPMWVYDVETLAFLAVNDAAVDKYGYSRDDFFQMTIKDIRPEDDIPRLINNVAHVTTGIDRAGYWRHRKKDGTIVDVEITSHTFLFEGRWSELVLVIDVTERKRIEDERERLITELEIKNSELERFTYTVSHDLKSPLVTIKGFLGFLKQDIASGNSERQFNDIERINNATFKMEQLLRDLLELSRIGRLVNQSEEVPFEDVIHEAMEIVHGQLEARGVTVWIQPDLPPVYGDHRRLTEVLQNLLDNAVKYMGDQTNARVEIGQRGKDMEGGKPIFYVKDNGIGIAPEHHERVFGLFNKLDVMSDGTGVGLAIVKRIIEFHGGRIWVESEGKGSGTTVCFTLPVPPEDVDREEDGERWRN